MICPNCGCDNLPGNEECSNCGQDLTVLDRPYAGTRVERSLQKEQVKDLCPKSPLTISPEATIQQAIQIMLEKDLGALLVVDGRGVLQGIFSERDLLKKVAGLQDPYAHLPVSDFMTKSPESVGPTDTLAFVLHKMDVGGYRHLPVVDKGHPVGVISVRDMLRHITHLCKES